MKTNITIELNPINCGIYEFRHIETGMAYVGSSIDVRSRIAQHFRDLSKSKHHSKKAQELYDASITGNSAFTATLIQSCSLEELDDIEEEYIQTGDYVLNDKRGKHGRYARKHGKQPKPKNRSVFPNRRTKYVLRHGRECASIMRRSGLRKGVRSLDVQG
ncbi:GIY-YIG nuclease family protein [Neorhizobium sp. NCHU2750]|uniref:GIY-YIG nuclease family protein n=1 Tax=Neorhizobium sp. NCHU2750 TaxID=1825976 RepID=UPI000E7564CB